MPERSANQRLDDFLFKGVAFDVHFAFQSIHVLEALDPFVTPINSGDGTGKVFFGAFSQISQERVYLCLAKAFDRSRGSVSTRTLITFLRRRASELQVQDREPLREFLAPEALPNGADEVLSEVFASRIDQLLGQDHVSQALSTVKRLRDELIAHRSYAQTQPDTSPLSTPAWQDVLMLARLAARIVETAKLVYHGGIQHFEKDSKNVSGSMKRLLRTAGYEQE